MVMRSVWGTKVMPLVAALLSGVLLAASFPKLSWWPLSWVGLLPLLWGLRRVPSSRAAFGLGVVMGSVFFLLLCTWMLALAPWGRGWVVVGWVLMSLLLGIPGGIFSLLAYRALRQGLSWQWMVGLSFVWILLEWLRTLGPFGMPLGHLGYTQVRLLPLIQVAEYVGVYGISFLVVLGNVAVAYLFWGRPSLCLRCVPVLGVLLMLVMVWGFGTHRLSVVQATMTKGDGTAWVRVAVVQPNIDQSRKLDFSQSKQILTEHVYLSWPVVARNKPDWVLWPETAMTTYADQKGGLARAQHFAKQAGVYLFLGAPHLVFPEGEGTSKGWRRAAPRIYNSVFLIGPDGAVQGRYDKKHLVPFGEYIPFRPLLGKLFSGLDVLTQDFSGNPNQVVLQAGDVAVGTMVCFESLFPALVRSFRKRGAQVMIVVTNDAWFGDTSAPYQHAAAAIFRAIENRCAVVQVANTGISLVVDPSGVVQKQTRLGRPAVVVETVAVRSPL